MKRLHELAPTDAVFHLLVETKQNSMTSVYFYLSSDHIEITSVEYEGYPSFQKGEVISLEVKNNLPDRWDVENVPMKEYTIVKIEHRAIKYYGSSANSQTMMYVFLSKL